MKTPIHTINHQLVSTLSIQLSLQVMISMLMFGLPFQAKSATKTFLGGIYSNSINWSPAGTPNNGDDIIVPTGISCIVDLPITTIWNNLTVDGILNFGVLTMPVLTSNIVYGNGQIITSSLSQYPLPDNKYWFPSVYYRCSDFTQKQYVRPGNYGILDASGPDNTNSGRIFVGRIIIRNDFNYETDTTNFRHTATGSHFIFEGGDMLLKTSPRQALIFDSLTISGTGTKTIQQRCSIRKYLNMESALLLEVTGRLFDSLNFVTTGSGEIRITNTSTTVLPKGKTWIPRVNYMSSNSQTIISGIYTNLIAGGGDRTFQNDTTIILETFIAGTGTYTQGTSVVVYASNNKQIIQGINYYTLCSEGNGERALDTTGKKIAIYKTFLPGLNTYSVSKSTISFVGSSQTIPSFTFSNLEIAGTGTKTLSGNIQVNDTLLIIATLQMSTFKLAGNDGFTVSPLSSGTVRTRNTDNNPLPSKANWPISVYYESTSNQFIKGGSYLRLYCSGGNRTVPSGDTLILNDIFTPGTGSYTTSGSTIVYAKNTSQSILGIPYYNLQILNAGVKQISQNLSVSNTLTVHASSVLDLGTYAFSVAPINILGSGTIRTSNTSASPLPAGKSWEPTIEYNSTSIQQIVYGNYSVLNMTGGSRILSSTGDIAISDSIIFGTGLITTTGSTIDYNGSKNQPISAFSYNNLKITGTGIKTATGNIYVGNNLHISSLLKLNNYQLSGVSSNTGYGYLTTADALGTGIPAHKLWTSGLVLDGNNDQLVPQGVYSRLFLSGTGSKHAQADLSISDSLIVSSTLDMGSYAIANGGTLKTSGTGIIKTSNVTATPLPSDLIWLPKVQYNYPGSQRIIAGTYTRLHIARGAAFSTKRITGNITISDSLIVSDTSILDIGNNILTVNGYFHFQHTMFDRLYTVAGSTIAVGGNTADAAGTLYFAINEGGARPLANLTLNRPGGSLTLSGDQQIRISGTVNVQSGILHTSNALILTSDASGTARIAALPSGADITGDITAERYVSAIARRWRTFSAPVSSFAFNQLIDNMFITGPGNQTNGFDSLPNGINLSNAGTTIYTYKEDTAGSARGWKGISHINNSLPTAKGSIVFIRGDRNLPAPDWYSNLNLAQNEVTLDFTGPINKGNISPAVTYTNTGNIINDGWNLIGNPYPSQIDWTLVSKTNLGPFIYLWNPSTNSYVANDGSNLIASGQAFFVKATGASPSVTFTESCKSASAPLSYFKSATPGISIKIVKDSISSDIAFLRFGNYTAAYNQQEDALKLSNLSGLNISLLTSGDSIPVQISAAPFPVNQHDTFVIQVNGTAGNYTLGLGNLQILGSGKTAHIKDLFTGSVHYLSGSNTFPFSVGSNPLSAGNRFLLIISNSSNLPVQFISFNGKYEPESHSNKLIWLTGSSVNVSHYVVEKSTDGISFSEIGITYARNSLSTNHYEFIDYTLTQGVNKYYYRIKSVDTDGSIQLSNMIMLSSSFIDSDQAANLTLVPNPCKANVQVQTDVASAIHEVLVYDLRGTIVLRSSSPLLQTSILPAGVYMVSVLFSNNSISGINRKLIVE